MDKKVDKNMKEINENVIEYGFVHEINEWIEAAEKKGMLENYLMEYGMREDISSEKVKICFDCLPVRPPRSFTNLNVSNLTKSKIRYFIEERQHFIFENCFLISKPLHLEKMKEALCKRVDDFYSSVIKKFSSSFENEKKKKLLEIALSQECTNTVFFSIKQFIEALKSLKGKILIECHLLKNNLILPVRTAVNEMKEPILLLMKNEKIKFLQEEVEEILDQVEFTVENLLRIEDIQNIPNLVQFLKLIRNEKIDSIASEEEIIKIVKECRYSMMKLEYCPKVIEFNVFCINFQAVWQQLKERAQKKILECCNRLRSDFHE